MPWVVWAVRRWEWRLILSSMGEEEEVSAVLLEASTPEVVIVWG
jgi:hypothetical protein